MLVVLQWLVPIWGATKCPITALDLVNVYKRFHNFSNIPRNCTQRAKSRGQHGAHLGPVGPRLSPCCPHEPCYHGHDTWISYKYTQELHDTWVSYKKRYSSYNHVTSAIYHNPMPSLVQTCAPHGQVPLVFTTCQIYPGITWYVDIIQEEIYIIQPYVTSAIYHYQMPSIVQRCTSHGQVALVFTTCQIYPGITWYMGIIQEEMSIIQPCVTSAIYHYQMPSIVQRCTSHGQVALVFTTCQIYPGITWYMGIIHEEISIIQPCVTSAMYHNPMPSIVQLCTPHGQVPLVFTTCQIYPGITWYVDITQEEISIMQPWVT